MNAAAAPATDTSLELKDPVCGMTVTAESPHILEHEGRPVYFCSAGCKTKFAADPRSTRSRPRAAAASPVGRRAVDAGHDLHLPDAPGGAPGSSWRLPKCGMALEPEMPSLEEGENPELVDFRRRFWWTLAADGA